VARSVDDRNSGALVIGDAARDRGTVGRLGHVPALDGVRGIAILLVLGYHVGWIPGGFLGVDVFFVLSGFLITTLLLEEWARDGGISFRAFYVRRARRLLPALLVLLATLGLLAAFEAAAGRVSDCKEIATSIAICLLYVANIWRASGHFLTGPLMQMWTLAQEEQFYILWPPLLLLALRYRLRLGGLAVGLAAATLSVIAWRIHLGPGPRSYFGPDAHADPLLVGCLLAVLHRQRLLARVRAATVVAAVAALAPAIVFVSGSGSPYWAAYALPAAELSTAVVIVAALQEGCLIERLLRFAPLVRLGVISYGLYLWQGLVVISLAEESRHYPLVLVRSVVVVASIGIAMLSYRYVEQPFRKKRRPNPAPAAAIIAPAG
jgi:peptidoglycan/LPS O-acetylase OafA/YrhL